MRFLCLVLVLLTLGCSREAEPCKPAPHPKPKTDAHFYYFGAAWCAPCQKMKATTFKAPEVERALSFFNVHFLDVDKDKIPMKCGHINAVPTYMVLEGEFKVVRRASGYKSPREFIDWLLPLDVGAAP